MLTILISWLCMGFSALIAGSAILKLYNIDICRQTKHIELVCLMGLCFLTVYAEVFSLFSGVSQNALIILLIIDILILQLLIINIIVYKKKYGYFFKPEKQKLSKKDWLEIILKSLIICIFAAIFVILSSRTPIHYDTYLYHAQSVRFIEELGVVPGLGNLHNRFAYNSAIFALDALFSLKTIFNQSIHGVDGFFEFIFITYAVLSFKGLKNNKCVCASNLLRIVLIIYFTGIENLLVVSSLGSDIPAIGLMLYILIKWLDLVEENESDTNIYAALCVLAVYAATVKLSVSMICLLAVFPIIQYIKKKEYGKILLSVVLCLLTAAPFFIRNVYISGYLIYPYAQLDFFAFDWKMNRSVLMYDSEEIKTWGRAICNYELRDMPFSEWFPNWYMKLPKLYRLCLMLTPFGIIYLFVLSIIRLLKDKSSALLATSMAVTASTVLWFLGSPDIRYGGVYLLIVPFISIGLHMNREVTANIQSGSTLEYINRIIRYSTTAVCVCFLVVLCIPFVKTVLQGDNSHLKRCADYNIIEGTSTKLGDVDIYIPLDTDQSGYYLFPATPYRGILDKLSLRGESLKDGFKIKEEFKETMFANDGLLLD